MTNTEQEIDNYDLLTAWRTWKLIDKIAKCSSNTVQQYNYPRTRLIDDILRKDYVFALQEIDNYIDRLRKLQEEIKTLKDKP